MVSVRVRVYVAYHCKVCVVAFVAADTKLAARVAADGVNSTVCKKYACCFLTCSRHYNVCDCVVAGTLHLGRLEVFRIIIACRVASAKLALIVAAPGVNLADCRYGYGVVSAR